MSNLDGIISWLMLVMGRVSNIAVIVITGFALLQLANAGREYNIVMESVIVGGEANYTYVKNNLLSSAMSLGGYVVIGCFWYLITGKASLWIRAK